MSRHQKTVPKFESFVDADARHVEHVVSGEVGLQLEIFPVSA